VINSKVGCFFCEEWCSCNKLHLNYCGCHHLHEPVIYVSGKYDVTLLTKKCCHMAKHDIGLNSACYKVNWHIHNTVTSPTNVNAKNQIH